MEENKEESSKEVKCKLSNIISDAQSFYIKGRNKWEVFEYLLNSILDITGSEYGFIGEVLYNENDTPFLRTYSTTNIAWIPIINSKSIAVITADASISTRKIIHEYGVENYFTKPFKTGDVPSPEPPRTSLNF